MSDIDVIDTREYRDAFRDGLEAAARFMEARANLLEGEGCHSLTRMMGQVYRDEAKAIRTIKVPR